MGKEPVKFAIKNKNMTNKTPQQESNNDLVVSYLYLRRIVGILGFAYPIVLAGGLWLYGHCHVFQDSISDYHNTQMRDVFVGLLAAISLFLFVYAGYDKLDAFMAKAAGILGFLVCIFPDDYDKDNVCALDFGTLEKVPLWFDKVHFSSAVLFFLVLAYFSIFLFTKSKEDNEGIAAKDNTVIGLARYSLKLFFQNQRSATKQELKNNNPKKAGRNQIYRWCGYIILICLIILAIYFLGDFTFSIFGIPTIYFFETIALWAFAFSWFVKGKTILKD